MEVRVEGTTVVGLVTAPPIAAKVLAGPAGPVLMLVGSAAGLLAGDSIHVRVQLAPGARLTVRTTAATIAHPCGTGAPTALEIECRLGNGARLAWLPEPLVACEGCHHYSHARLYLAADAMVVWLDTLALGRVGERPGRLQQRLDVELDGRPLLREGLRLDGLDPAATPGWDGPAIIGPHRHVAALHLLGRRLPPDTPGVMQLAGPGTTARLLARRGDQLARQVTAMLPPFLHPFTDPANPSPGAMGPGAKEAVHV